MSIESEFIEAETIIDESRRDDDEKRLSVTARQAIVMTEMIDLNDGEDLSTEAAARITVRGQAKVVLVAGDADSGKTTLIASIYEKLQLGPFEDYLFAGSESLMGFERRCWRSRIVSNSHSAEMDRTPTGTHGLLHLRLRHCQGSIEAPQDLLLVDISGEDFREARNSNDACERIVELRRADHVALLIDGAKLTNPTLRHEALRNIRLLLQRFLDSEMLSRKAVVEILFTKYDIVEPYETASGVHEFIRNAETTLRQAFEERVGGLLFFRVAARPKTKGFALAHGLGSVVSTWLKDTPIHFQAKCDRMPAFDVEREFDRYLKRRLSYLYNEGV